MMRKRVVALMLFRVPGGHNGPHRTLIQIQFLAK
jgi:hypothetical protein